ncbi:hypothetical protein TSOC_002688 [Tetrabaena socialis]|uniref:Uncharacterized protein n=1 Tax=Tetrabaena socialis TaxID=47790 RepID=A0A2J8ADJ2_9CHLO|nr:hypothetical protein TSOC_002688 [Tetrabaena socialis]|eukprot:PNH10590.1 hypothetical protein TSOC_002688 [Tetrabaena socialis]
MPPIVTDVLIQCKKVVAYRSELGDLLLQRAQAYADVTANAGKMTDEAVARQIAPFVGAKGVRFQADGVIYRSDRTRDVTQLTHALARQHAAYEHLVYRPVVSAVNEEQGVVFTAIYFVLRNRGALFGASAPSGRISKGFLVDKLGFDKNTGALVSSLVTRQLTLEERDALLPDPTKWQPAVVEEGELVAVPDVVAGPNDHKYMAEIISNWAGVWSSEASVDVLEKVLAPDCRAYDGYGLANKPNGILWQAVDEARKIILATHERYDNRNQLVSYAVSHEHKLGFHHWRANAVDKERVEQPIEGIHNLYEFDMKPYPLKAYAP